MNIYSQHPCRSRTQNNIYMRSSEDFVILSDGVPKQQKLSRLQLSSDIEYNTYWSMLTLWAHINERDRERSSDGNRGGLTTRLYKHNVRKRYAHPWLWRTTHQRYIIKQTNKQKASGVKSLLKHQGNRLYIQRNTGTDNLWSRVTASTPRPVEQHQG